MIRMIEHWGICKKDQKLFMRLREKPKPNISCKICTFAHKGDVPKFISRWLSTEIYFYLSGTFRWPCEIFYNLIICSVRPKPGFSIRNRNQAPILVWVSEPKLFFLKPKLIFPKKFKKNKFFVMFSHFLGRYRFL